jgi:hypothetical protein
MFKAQSVAKINGNTKDLKTTAEKTAKNPKRTALSRLRFDKGLNLTFFFCISSPLSPWDKFVSLCIENLKLLKFTFKASFALLRDFSKSLYHKLHCLSSGYSA